MTDSSLLPLQTPVAIDMPPFSIEPCERMLFVGSCFADEMGQRFHADRFRTTVNPYGVMYNPASILHTVERYATEVSSAKAPHTAVFTLGTNHVYVLNATGQIVDNCHKRPHHLFTERQLTVDQCADYLKQAIEVLRRVRSDVRVVITVSPIRYAKYGFHGSALSKATLLLAADRVVQQAKGIVVYFPAYEIVNDQLRDYRFYREDMLHPTAQAVDYIWHRFANAYFSAATHVFLKQWHPIKAALAHRPFNADSADYKAFLAKAKADEMELMKKYGVEEE